jgi:RNA polymerase sigma-70 factor (ECF subfamily)
MLTGKAMTEKARPVPLTTAADETQAFRRFFEANYMKLRSALSIMCRDPSLADEVAQDSFTRVWEHWHRVSRMSAPEAYLFRVGINSLRDRKRRDRRSSQLSPRDEQAAPDEFALIDTMTALEAAILRLPARQREALVVTSLLGYDSSGAARILGVRPGTVRRLASLARKRLTAEMETEGRDG